MKSLIILFAVSLLSNLAMAEGPLLKCEASRTIPKADGSGFMVDAEKTIYVSSTASSLEKHQFGKSEVTTYLRVDGYYVLLLKDQEIDARSSSTGNIKGSGHGTLSLSGNDVDVFVACDVI